MESNHDEQLNNYDYTDILRQLQTGTVPMQLEQSSHQSEASDQKHSRGLILGNSSSHQTHSMDFGHGNGDKESGGLNHFATEGNHLSARAEFGAQ